MENEVDIRLLVKALLPTLQNAENKKAATVAALTEALPRLNLPAEVTIADTGVLHSPGSKIAVVTFDGNFSELSIENKKSLGELAENVVAAIFQRESVTTEMSLRPGNKKMQVNCKFGHERILSTGSDGTPPRG